VRIFTDIELYALFFSCLGLLLAHRASKIPQDAFVDSTKNLWKKKNALIVNEIAMSLNFAVCLLYFVFLPIVYGSRAFEKDVHDHILNAIAYFVSAFACLFHFASSKWALLDQDWTYIFWTLVFWMTMNLIFESNGLIFRDLIGETLIIKMFIASFFMLANICFYYLLCISSQFIKGMKEKHEKQKIFQTDEV
jgi:uncharacterized membrane protein